MADIEVASGEQGAPAQAHVKAVSTDVAELSWVKMSATSAEKTAFSTSDGLFEFIVMPFGLQCTSNVPTSNGSCVGWPDP